MANSLLDFVLSVVRDPETAARYAADPEGTLAAANLAGVTGADVENLIPVVAESLSMNLSGSGVDPFGAEPADNVWATGAATAAFDAFGDQVPDPLDTPLLDRVGADAFDVESNLPVTVDLDDAGMAAPMSSPIDAGIDAGIEDAVFDDALLGGEELPTYQDPASPFDIFD
ncbi:Rv0340 family IniB-related protein [Mycobacterium sp. pV006]|uniref:Rv0340 family IniB-related protein n=1 Tax=Mycobacterium sp. pV006 TaxID=3238983 RepID=UPI00351ADABD